MSEDFVPHHKIVLLGNSGCGKTSIINRYVSEAFNLELKSTVGGNHQKKRIQMGGKPVDLFIWDTAGQERFQALMPLYARSSDGAIIVASITDNSSFDSLGQWCELVKEACTPTPPLILCVNKIDDAEHALVSTEDILKKYAGKFKATYFVSALTGESISELFECVAIAASEYASKNTQQHEAPKQAKQTKEGSCC